MISDELKSSQVVAASAIGFAECYNPYIDEPWRHTPIPSKEGTDVCLNLCGEFFERFMENMEENTAKRFSDLASCISVKWECDPDYEYLKNWEPLPNNRTKRSTHEENIVLKVISILGRIDLILASLLG